MFARGCALRGYIDSCLDTTDLKLAQESALGRQKLKSIDMLIAGIAHDFNSMLSSIIAETEIALSAMDAGQPPVEEIQRIRTVALRAAEIVSHLMVYSQERVDFEPVQISSLVREMVDLLKASISKHATLKTDFEENLPSVRGHATQIRRIVMNLVINASEAIGEKEGMITVTTSRVSEDKELAASSATGLPQGDYVRLEVSDTGYGMTEEQKTRIFHPFFTTKFSGSGLGLAVVQGIVLAHGGGINVVSTPDQGTTIQVFLPCWGQAETQRYGVKPSTSGRPS
jgi:signal transduction histidine kinase